MLLTNDQTTGMYENGFVRLPGILPRCEIGSALQAINFSLGQKGMHPDELPDLRSQSYCREMQTDRAITDLFNATPLSTLSQQFLGEGNVSPVKLGQIALRFPNRPHGGQRCGPVPHLDGMHAPHNGMPPGSFGTFTALAGIFLSDLPAEFCGNFAVWPGTHRSTEAYFQEHGPEKFLEGLPPIELPSPVQITARAGDAVFCHYQLAHSVALNFSPNIRYAIFFRLKHKDHDNHRREVLADIWRDWPAMTEYWRAP